MIVVSHPTGNQNVRQAARAFAEAGLLQEFWTTLNWNRDGIANRFLPRRIQELLNRRSFPEISRSKMRTLPGRELGRLLLGPRSLPFLFQHENGAFSIDQVSAALDRKVAARLRHMRNCDLIYAYEDAALESFRVARERNIARVYELPIGYWRAADELFAEECEREPEWAVTLIGARDSGAKRARKDEELHLAERIIVASSFTRRTLASASFRAPVEVIPYGAPPVVGEPIEPRSGKVRVLFVGSLEQRKGLSYLFKAMEPLKEHVELTLLGRKVVPDCRPLEIALKKYRWIPSLDHAGVLREMREHDILVFPSLFEGFGLVILEAMAQGTPVITTPNTAGPDLIDDGVEGFIVPIRSVEAIAEKIELLAHNRELLHAMKSAARRKAALRSWDTYRQRLAEMAREVIARELPTT